MKLVVRKGYVVRHNGKLYREGTEVPSPISKEVLKNQSWKVNILEEMKGGNKEEEKQKREETEKPEGTEEIKDLVNDRMVGDSLIKRRGK